MFSTRPGLRVPVQSANQDDPMNGNGPAELTSQIVHCALTPQLLGRRQANLSLVSQSYTLQSFWNSCLVAFMHFSKEPRA